MLPLFLSIERTISWMGCGHSDNFGRVPSLPADPASGDCTNRGWWTALRNLVWILHLRTLPVHATVLMHGGLQRGVGFSSWSRADLLGDSQLDVWIYKTIDCQQACRHMSGSSLRSLVAQHGSLCASLLSRRTKRDWPAAWILLVKALLLLSTGNCTCKKEGGMRRPAELGILPR